MDNNAEILEQAVALTDTSLEGFENIKAKLNEGQLEHTMMYFNHIANSFYDILQSIHPVLEKLPPNELEPLSKSVHDALGSAVSAYEKKDSAEVLEIMQFTLVPAYKKWKAELDRCCQLYRAI